MERLETYPVFPQDNIAMVNSMMFSRILPKNFLKSSNLFLQKFQNNQLVIFSTYLTRNFNIEFTKRFHRKLLRSTGNFSKYIQILFRNGFMNSVRNAAIDFSKKSSMGYLKIFLEELQVIFGIIVNKTT